MIILGRILVFIGLVAILHAGYSAVQCRTYYKLLEEEFTSLPVDIFIQCLLGMLFGCVGVVLVAGEFKEIRAAAEMASKSWESLGNRPSFYTFNHRGKKLYSDLPQSSNW
ncbi:membrane magnesium transporter 1 [Exaiptasia diaphana]|uniref:Membrane magnesium transporter n=1 Tax=Exaiptasia diaphana TaxID=2652724 RepID=A0A913XQF9_EXADI|nr:membrane magnesium transporter 1 [Exaiptasia diaphana]KXJ25135.1 Membrane magnesium transporter 1 [Exaiptasia diaphana]